MDVVKEIREKAVLKARASFPTPFDSLRKINPYQTMLGLDWDVPVGQTVDQAQVIEWNMQLAAEGCLGRVAQMAAILENIFGDVKLESAEVLQDWLRDFMLNQILPQKKPGDADYHSAVQEVLLYEEPHLILVADGEQLEYLSKQLQQRIVHPKIQTFGLWQGIAASYLVSKSNSQTAPKDRLGILKQAENLCPGMTLVKENKAAALLQLGREQETLKLLKECQQQRPCARTLFSLWLLTGLEYYRVQLEEVYTPYILTVLLEESGIG